MNRKENRWTAQELRDLGRADAFLEEGQRILKALSSRHTVNGVHMQLVRVRKERKAATEGGAQ